MATVNWRDINWKVETWDDEDGLRTLAKKHAMEKGITYKVTIEIPDPFFELLQPTGSRYCTTLYEDTSDNDVVAYTTVQDKAVIDSYMNSQGFYFSKDWNNGASLSYKDHSDVVNNIIVVRDRLMFERWVSATRACKHLNMFDKLARKKLFHKILYDEDLPREFYPRTS